jgi:hypothetical protein
LPARSQVLEAAGLPASLPRARTFAELVRKIHAAPISSNEAPLSTVLALLTAQLAPTDDSRAILPLPLTPDVWRRSILRQSASDADLAWAILGDRRASLMYLGLAAVDTDTRRYLGARPELLERLTRDFATVFSGTAAAIAIHDGSVDVPGGNVAVEWWAELAGGASPADPERFLPALFSEHDGRLAFFFATVSQLDRRRQPIVLGRPQDDKAKRRERLTALYEVFREMEPGWDPRARPFHRVPFDLETLLANLTVGDTGAWIGPGWTGLWEAVFASDQLPQEPIDGLSKGGWVDATDLARRVLTEPMPGRQLRMQAVWFAERAFAGTSAEHAFDVLVALRAYGRFPQLSLTLERCGIRDPVIYAAAARQATRVQNARDDNSQETALVLFQSSLALIDRLHRAGAVTSEAAVTLVRALTAPFPPDDVRYSRWIGDWITTSLMPALNSPERNRLEGGLEDQLLEGLAGFRGVDPATGRRVRWEEFSYRFDPASPELARLREVRELQGSNRLDVALAAGGLVEDLIGARSAADLRQAAAGIAAIADEIVSLEQSERPSARSSPDLMRLHGQIQQDLRRVTSPSDSRLGGTRTRLQTLADALLVDALLSIVYAAQLGEPDGQAFLAGNVARRHDFGLHDRTPDDPQRRPWQLAVEQAGSGQPWHLRGSLLGLDVALARLALRRVETELPLIQPTLNESDRRTFIYSLALSNVASLDESSGAAILAAIRRARARVAGLTPASPDFDALTTRAGITGVRRELLGWAVAYETEAVPSFFTLSDLFWIERPDSLPGRLDAWGAAQTLLTGCLCLRFPQPGSPAMLAGRAGSGHLSTGVADLTLHLLEQVADLQLPMGLTRGVLAGATQDYIDSVTMAYPDDWMALTEQVRLIGPDRIANYVAALTARGPLVPVEDTPAGDRE